MSVTTTSGTSLPVLHLYPDINESLVPIPYPPSLASIVPGNPSSLQTTSASGNLHFLVSFGYDSLQMLDHLSSYLTSTRPALDEIPPTS